MGEAHDGGESPDTNSPEDCLCMASARGSVPWHERSRVPQWYAPSSPHHLIPTKLLTHHTAVGGRYP